jgi:hypothetical protein
VAVVGLLIGYIFGRVTMMGMPMPGAV